MASITLIAIIGKKEMEGKIDGGEMTRVGSQHTSENVTYYS